MQDFTLFEWRHDQSNRAFTRGIRHWEQSARGIWKKCRLSNLLYQCNHYSLALNPYLLIKWKLRRDTPTEMTVRGNEEHRRHGKDPPVQQLTADTCHNIFPQGWYHKHQNFLYHYCLHLLKNTKYHCWSWIRVAVQNAARYVYCNIDCELLVYDVSIVFSFCKSQKINMMSKDLTKHISTSILNPIFWQTNLTSSKSSSIDGSLVVLFSQCHKRGPWGRNQRQLLKLGTLANPPRFIHTPPGARILCIIRR